MENLKTVGVTFFDKAAAWLTDINWTGILLFLALVTVTFTVERILKKIVGKPAADKKLIEAEKERDAALAQKQYVQKAAKKRMSSVICQFRDCLGTSEAFIKDLGDHNSELLKRIELLERENKLLRDMVKHDNCDSEWRTRDERAGL